MRFLKAIRLSVLTDETTSPQRQDEVIDAEIARRGGTAVGTASDLDVSASDLGPFERPELGEWLTDAKAQLYDGIIWWRLDRAVRSMADLHLLGGWARKHGKRLIFASGPGGSPLELDMSSPISELLATILAFAAQMESQATKERVSGARAFLRVVARWGGGKPAYGYRIVPIEGGSGDTIEEDPEPAEVLREIVRRIIGDGRPETGDSANSIAIDLNARGIPSPRDYNRGKNGIKVEVSAKWLGSSVLKIAKSQASLGYVMHNGRPVTGPDGMPRRFAKGIISDADYVLMQKVLKARSTTKKRTHGASLLLGIAVCGEDGLPWYRWNRTYNGKVYSYYRCKDVTQRSDNPRCASKMIKSEELETTTIETLLALTGELEVMERRLIPGADHTADLERVERRIAELREDREAGLWEGEDDHYRGAMQRLRSWRDELAALPQVPDTWEEVPTGRTFRQVWDALEGVKEQRDFLLASGVKAVIHSNPIETPALLPGMPALLGERISLQVPPNLQARIREHALRSLRK